MHQETVAALRKYENNPAHALADGPLRCRPDRPLLHMVAPERIANPGPEFGGCLTRWHDHGAEGFGLAFNGRGPRRCSTAGSYLPMVCRETEEHSACTP